MKAINFFLPKNLFADHSCENISFFGLFSQSDFPFFKLLTFVEFFQFLVPFFRPVRITVNFVKILFHAANLSTYKLPLFFKKQSFFQQSLNKVFQDENGSSLPFSNFGTHLFRLDLECSFFFKKERSFYFGRNYWGAFYLKKFIPPERENHVNKILP